MSATVRAVGYVRVSTRAQADEGYSLSAQRERVTAYCAAQGWELVEICADEGLSAKDTKRAGLQRARAILSDGDADALLVLKLDRLTRDVSDLNTLVKELDAAEQRLASVSENLDTGTATGRMLVNMLGVFAQWEREIIGERTSAALRERMRQGKHVGAVPFGYVRDGDTVRATARRGKVEKRIRALRGEGLSYRAIAERLPDGISWQTVRRIHGGAR